MATRQMVGTRKGAPKAGVDIVIGMGKPKGSSDDGVTCPNCACQFDPASGDVMKPGKPVEGGDDYGADLGTSEPPVPGKFGAAHDAAGGEQALTSALASVLAGSR